MRGSPAPAGAQTVIRALTILKAFTRERPRRQLAELARSLNLTKTTVFRLLRALESEGMVERDTTSGDYCLGPEAVALGTRALFTTDLRTLAHAELQWLAVHTGETATLDVLVDADVLIIDEVHGRHIVGASPEIGMRWPAHATSTGKVLLAAAYHEAGRGGLPAGRLRRLTARTITSRARLERELAVVWRRGCATTVEEVEPGFVAVAAPVRDHEGRTIAALSVGGPRARVTPRRTAELAAHVRRSADRLSARLGAVPAAALGPRAILSPRRDGRARAGV
jgi:DNA-binding IclR family transcriptional regulator